ncbi:RelA/SpoT domain-containing protein [bacterium]|nr:RelA/SpoT domain-containing protein [bacterium]
MNKTEFLKSFNVSETDFRRAGYSWKFLQAIKNDYLTYRQPLEQTCKDISERLVTHSNVHSIKRRLKDPYHLIEKIIRKKNKNNEFDISIDNYKSLITDLSGVRVLHLYKEDWLAIHNFISTTWKLKEKPIANIRNGDSLEYINEFEKYGCDINEHEHGYRSIHYLVESQPTVEKHITEIQVRTIFEEGWAEVDHDIRYPYDTDHVIINQFIHMFNRLAGSADEMSSFIKYLKRELITINDDFQTELNKKARIIEELKITIESLKVDRSAKKSLNDSLNTLSNLKFMTGNTIAAMLNTSDINSGAIHVAISSALMATNARNMILDSHIYDPHPSFYDGTSSTEANLSEEPDINDKKDDNDMQPEVSDD